MHSGKAWETPFGDYAPRLEGGAAASMGVAHAVVRLCHELKEFLGGTLEIMEILFTYAGNKLSELQSTR